MSLDTGVHSGCRSGGLVLSQKQVGGILQALADCRKGNIDMTKSLDLITEVIRNPKHAFRQADSRPAKPQKHRYERRKIRELMRLGDWSQDLS